MFVAVKDSTHAVCLITCLISKLQRQWLDWKNTRRCRCYRYTSRCIHCRYLHYTNLPSSIFRNLYTEMFNIYSHTQRIHYNVLLNVKRAQLWLNNHHQHQPWLQRSGHHQDVAEVDMVDQGILKQLLAWSDSMCCSWSSWRYQKHPTQLLGLHVLLLEHSRNTQEQASLYSVHTFIFLFYVDIETNRIPFQDYHNVLMEHPWSRMSL